MPTERRGRQNQALVTRPQDIHSNEHTGNKGKEAAPLAIPDRWTRISLKAQDHNLVFSNLHTHINVDSLREAFKAIDGSKARGVDGVSKAEYGRNLEENLSNLADRVQKGSYRPKPKREVLIPKDHGKTRPIAIACFEDKLVDWAVAKILSVVFEPLFIRNSFGYRPSKSADGAIKACYYALCKDRRQQVVEIDFSDFFNTIPHKKLMRFLGKRISDRRFKGLIGRFLKGGLVTQQAEHLPSVLGTPQGSIMSPVLANIYLNEVLDHWFLKYHASWDNVMVRYADDAVFFFKEEKQAAAFLDELGQRVSQYGLSLNQDKTRTLQLTKANHQHFHFLGFTFYWGRQGTRCILKVKTQKTKLIKAIRDFEQWIKNNRNRLKLKELWRLARAKIRGHVNYFGYWMNALKLNHFYQQAKLALFKWLNRRSQKRSYRWAGFKERLERDPLMLPLREIKLKSIGWNPYA